MGGGGGGRSRWVGIKGVKREMLWSRRDPSLDSSCQAYLHAVRFLESKCIIY